MNYYLGISIILNPKLIKKDKKRCLFLKIKFFCTFLLFFNTCLLFCLIKFILTQASYVLCVVCSQSNWCTFSLESEFSTYRVTWSMLYFSDLHKSVIFFNENIGSSLSTCALMAYLPTLKDQM